MKFSIQLIVFFLATQLAFAAEIKDKAAIKRIKSNLTKTEKSIQLTKERIKSPQDVEYLPDLYFSLAELYLEKSRLSYSLKLESRPGTPADEIDFTAEKRMKQEAVEIYKNIKDRFLQFAQRDRVLFVLASELKDLNDMDASLKVFKELTEKYPQSTYWEKAQLAIGGIFFERKDFEFAKQQYVKILAREEKPIFAFVHFKIGQCEIFLDRFLESMLEFEKAVKISNKYQTQILSGETDHLNIKEDALIASVWPITEISAAQLSKYPQFLKPINYYMQLSDDKAVYRRVLSRLARRLSVKSRDFDAAQTYYEMLRLSDDPEMRREALEGYYLKMKSSKREFFPEQIVDLLRDTVRSFKMQNIKYEKYEPLYRDVATSVHKMAQTSKRKVDLENAIAAYQDYLHFFPNTKYKMGIRVNLAEVQYLAGHNIAASQEFFALAALKETREKERKDYLSSALKSLSENFEKSPELTILERAQGRTIYRQVAGQFVKTYPRDAEVDQIKFNIAKTYYDEKDYKSAVAQLRNFLKENPRSSRNQEAALLLLDTYYTRDDLKGLVQEGKGLLAANALTPGARKKVQDIIQQSEIKNVRQLAGEFGSKDYSNKILQFAKSNKSSGLGETALFEAFVSLRAAQDEKVFSVGEDYLGTFPQSAKGKEILLSMTQMALVTVDFSRATKYLVAFAQKYPQDGQSKSFLAQAAAISEQMGFYTEGVMAYQSLGQPEKVAQLLEKSGNWSELQKAASKLGGVKSLYYQGNIYLNTNKRNEAMGVFRQLTQQTGSTFEEKSMIAKAGYIVADHDINEFKKSLTGLAFTPQNLTAKVTQHQEIERSLQNVISLGVGEWTIGALYLSGKINTELTAFLKNATPPAGMPAAKLAQILAPQIANYSGLATSAFSKCVQAAEANDVFTEIVPACQSKNMNYQLVAKSTARRGLASSSGEIITTRKALYKSPRDIKTLYTLVNRLVQDGNYSQAFATLSRMMEYEPNNSTWMAEAGVMSLYLNEIETAVATFKETLKKNSKDATALWGLAAVYQKYGFTQQGAKYLSAARAAGRPKGITHPWMKL